MDLKPENLLFENDTAEAQIKVIDFGYSQFFEPKQKMQRSLGSPYFMAPEVFENSYTEKCDIWSCGVILYILLCGKLPFSGRNVNEVILNIQKGELNL